MIYSTLEIALVLGRASLRRSAISTVFAIICPNLFLGGNIESFAMHGVMRSYRLSSLTDQETPGLRPQV